MTKITIPNNWQPRNYQLDAWRYLENGGKHAELIWHRRSGKDEVALHRTACAAFERQASYWHMLPEYSQARKAIWAAINPHTGRRRIDEAFPLELRSNTREQEMSITFKNGSTWQVVGSDSYNSLVGSSPAGIVYSEWGLANPNARAYLRPIIAENNGWQLFITTPRGRNHAHTTLQSAQKNPESFAQILDARQSGVFTEQQLQIELQAYIDDFGMDYGTSRFEQEYLCSFDAANLGAILARSITEIERKGQIGDDVSFDNFGSTFDITADIGRRDTSAWWFWQPKIGGYTLFDYDDGFGLDAEEWCIRLRTKIDEYALEGRKTALGTIWLPHDARAKTFAAKRSAIEIFIDYFGTDHVKITPQSHIPDRVNAARVMINKCEFNALNCQKGLEALRAWSYSYSDEAKIFSNTPVHDWACFVAGTKIETINGDKKIENIVKGDSVFTPSGYRKVTGTHEYNSTEIFAITLNDGREINCTGNHKLFTQRGLVAADALSYDDILYTGKELSWKIISLILKVAGTTGIHTAITDSYQQENNARKGLKKDDCIGIFGCRSLGKYPLVMRFITWMKTQATIILKTCNVCQKAIIGGCTEQKMATGQRIGIKQKKDSSTTRKFQKTNGQIIETSALKKQKLVWNLREKLQKLGMGLRKAKNGIVLQVKPLGKIESNTPSYVQYAIKSLLHIGRIVGSTAGKIVMLKRTESAQKVYDITVADDHCYIANGVLTSNSHSSDAFSYGCVIMQQVHPKIQTDDSIRGINVLDNKVTINELLAQTPKRTQRRI